MNPDRPSVSVIIVNYNAGAFLQRSVDSLAAQEDRDFELIIVDNNSTDGSIEAVRTDATPQTRVLRQPRNLGFAAANNLAAREARGEWLALLNPDAFAAPDWLARFRHLRSHFPQGKSFASAQFNAEDPQILDGAGDAYCLFGFPWRGGFGRPARELPPQGFCFSACGAGAFYERDLFLTIGGFDEAFFCYCEDVDLGFRLQLAGFDCVFDPVLRIDHVGSGVTGQMSAFSTFHGARNRVWAYVKSMPIMLLVLTLPGHMALTLYVLARNAFTPRFWPMARGLAAGVTKATAMRQKGQSNRRARRISLWQLARRFAWNPWRMSARKPHVRMFSDQ